MIEFFVHGKAVPESRIRTRGGFQVRAGKVKRWCEYVRDTARQYRTEDSPWDGALQLTVGAYVNRPASVSIKKRPLPTVRPDAENILKVVADALTGILYRDDAQLVNVHLYKRYADPALNFPPGVRIILERLTEVWDA